MSYNFFLCEIWINGRQELIDNPVQECYYPFLPCMINSEEIFIWHDIPQNERYFIYLN